MVPADAVHTDATGTFVWVVDENNTLRRTAVDIGQVTGGRIEITAGLTAGQTVVTLGRDLNEGALVKPASSGPEPNDPETKSDSVN